MNEHMQGRIRPGPDLEPATAEGQRFAGPELCKPQKAANFRPLRGSLPGCNSGGCCLCSLKPTCTEAIRPRKFQRGEDSAWSFQPTSATDLLLSLGSSVETLSDAFGSLCFIDFHFTSSHKFNKGASASLLNLGSSNQCLPKSGCCHF